MRDERFSDLEKYYFFHSDWPNDVAGSVRWVVLYIYPNESVARPGGHVDLPAIWSVSARLLPALRFTRRRRCEP